MGFLFWKKKRKDEPEVAAPVEVIDVVVEDAVVEEVIAAEPEPTPVVVVPEPEPTPIVVVAEPEPVIVAPVAPAPVINVPVEVAPAPEVVEELEAVELPKRSARKGIRSLFSRIKFDPANLDDLEDILIQADFGVDASSAIVDEVKAAAKKQGAKSEADLKKILAQIIAANLEHPAKALNLSDGKLPYVFLVVGVNGVGKTTTIGKLAKWMTEGGWKVVIGAADTFRAAAVDQVATWAERAGAQIVKPKLEGQDPAAVAFEAVEAAIKSEADVLIIDTAGRLQNKKDLMNELDKIRRVVEKQASIAEVLLVLDATTGQNGLTQAKAFTEVANVTGVVLTKLDGTAKGGIVYSIQRELGIPVKLVGVGEGIEDFAFFDAQEFANGLVS
ncbi:signal recognition particle-docking protein FtsY [Rhodoluna sp.]|uniref:signal recognition particle-docking protein FtsY n=1 Tax=Rhodoluna sp. TaxID=1969481 RepID=UPI0025F710F2|nr:signal recognition particle-docking protein FtsY [Rhodoluna sp.]